MFNSKLGILGKGKHIPSMPMQNVFTLFNTNRGGANQVQINATHMFSFQLHRRWRY